MERGKRGKKKKKEKDRDISKDLKIRSLERELEVMRSRASQSGGAGKTGHAGHVSASPVTSDSEVDTQRSDRRQRRRNEDARRTSQHRSESRTSSRYSGIRSPSRARDGHRGGGRSPSRVRENHYAGGRSPSRTHHDHRGGGRESSRARDDRRSASRSVFGSRSGTRRSRSRSQSIVDLASYNMDGENGVRPMFDSPAPTRKVTEQQEEPTTGSVDEPWQTVQHRKGSKPQRTAPVGPQPPPPAARGRKKSGWWHRNGVMVNAFGETRPLNAMEELLHRNVTTYGTGMSKKQIP